MADAIPLLREAVAPLIIIPRDPSTDALAAGLGLYIALETQGKRVQIVSPDFTLPETHTFLPKSASVKQGLGNLRDLVISVNVEKTPLESLRYDVANNKLHLYLTPKSGLFDGRDVAVTPGSFAFDLIISVGLLRREDLGSVFHDHAEFFLNTPTIAIGNQPSHQRYAQVNIVDVVASSQSEIVYELLEKMGGNALDEFVATNLLTGIISQTKGFQSSTVTPRSLAIASHLLSAGARRDVIVQNLYQTKTVPVLKLWGRALSKLTSTPDKKVVWTTITREDLRATGATEEVAGGLLDELVVSASEGAAAVLVERDGGIDAYVIVRPPVNLPTLPDTARRIGESFAVVPLTGTMSEAEKTIRIWWS